MTKTGACCQRQQQWHRTKPEYTHNKRENLRN